VGVIYTGNSIMQGVGCGAGGGGGCHREPWPPFFPSLDTCGILFSSMEKGFGFWSTADIFRTIPFEHARHVSIDRHALSS
jgi:hypothetical protein